MGNNHGQCIKSKCLPDYIYIATLLRKVCLKFLKTGRSHLISVFPIRYFISLFLTGNWGVFETQSKIYDGAFSRK